MASIPPDELTYEATELNETIDYYFRVSAKNKHGVSSPLETESTVKPKSKFGKNGKSVLLDSFIVLWRNMSDTCLVWVSQCFIF